MTSTSKRIILMEKEQSDSLLGRFFKEQGIEIHTEYILSEVYLFAVDNVCPEVLNLPRLQTLDKLQPALQANVRCRLNQDMMMATLGKKLFETYFNEVKEFNIVERFSAEMKKVINFKIHEALNIGYFVDSIIIEAFKSKFEIVKLRNYLNKAFMYAIERNENNVDDLPINISFSHDSDAFAVQIVINVESFDEKNEMHFFTDELTKYCNFLDIAFVSKRKQLHVSAVSFKRENLQNANAYIFTEIGSREAGDLPDNVELISGLKFNQLVEYKAAPKEVQTDKFILASKIADFIISYRQTEQTPKSSDELKREDIESYLAYYPLKINSRIVDLEMKEFILKLVKNEQLFSSVFDYVKKIALTNDQVEISGQSLLEVDAIQVIKGEVSKKEDVNVIRGGPVEKEAFTVIKGSANEKEAITVVKGSSAANEDEKVTIVKGSSENHSDKNHKFVISGGGEIPDYVQRMEVKSSQTSNELESDVTIIKSDPIHSKNDDVMKIKSLSSNATEANNSELKAEELNQQAFFHIKDKLEIQVSKMKALIDTMKIQNTKLKEDLASKDEALILSSVGSSPTVSTPPSDSPAHSKKFELEAKENIMLKNSLVKAIEVIKLKDKQISKAKTDSDMANLAKDLKTKSLEDKIELLKIDLSRAKDTGHLDKLKELEHENRNLLSRLDLAKGKVSTMSENLESKDHDSLVKYEREIESLKSGMSVAQATIDRLRSEKSEIELRMSVDRDLLAKYRDEKDVPGGSPKLKLEMAEKDNLIHSLTLEKRTAEDKHKLVTMELKKTEQRLKFAISQLEASTKKRDGTGAAAQKSAEAYAKQLDSANARLVDAANEVTDKKKEILKLKQENSLLSLKLTDLEKKISQLEKKAA